MAEIKNYRVVDETEFRTKITSLLVGCKAKSVTGPGRSGAIAAVYASYLLDIPFVPFGRDVQPNLLPLLIVDTARYSGSTMIKAAKRYQKSNPILLWAYDEPPMVRFWFEFQGE